MLGRIPPGSAGTTKYNFMTATGAKPTGYFRDYGRPFDPSLGYGWVSTTSSAPRSIEGNGREREVHPDQRRDTFVHMQAGTPARWEKALSNGSYRVTVAVGDPAPIYN